VQVLKPGARCTLDFGVFFIPFIIPGSTNLGRPCFLHNPSCVKRTKPNMHRAIYNGTLYCTGPSNPTELNSHMQAYTSIFLQNV
jgi:hypothetical protein